MKIDLSAVRVGGFYVCDKKGLVREITAETADGMVHWRSYWLADGRSTGDSFMCSKNHMRQLSNREATEDEQAGLYRDGPEHREIAAMAMINFVVTNISDDQLITEICRRGYRVVHEESHDLKEHDSARPPRAATDAEEQSLPRSPERRARSRHS